MKEIKLIGTYQRVGISQPYLYSLFECPVCGKHVEKIRRDGIKAKACSHKCSRTGIRRGAYTEKVLISGYYYNYKPEHPNAIKRGYVAEHRLVAEKMIGRFLHEDEVVHHINENKLDNRPENLEVMKTREHISLHANKKRRGNSGKFAI